MHFVFTGNPGTGKTTVARIVAKILFGFEVLESDRLIETDRAGLVGGYVGQTAIKTSEVIARAVGGVLFIDEAYALSKGQGASAEYGSEAIETLLKRMEDFRHRLVLIVAGYPALMQTFLASNPGLESRFTRFIHFDDYHVSELCQIFERMAETNGYVLTQEARACAAILFNRAHAQRNESFGNGRFVRNAFELAVGKHADRLAVAEGEITRKQLSTIEPNDVPMEMSGSDVGRCDLSNSRWHVQCPECRNQMRAEIAMIGNTVQCNCGATFVCPWWNLDASTVPGLGSFVEHQREADLLGIRVV